MPRKPIDETLQQMEKRKRPEKQSRTSAVFPTASTLLNLSTSGIAEGSNFGGKIINIIGDSHAGKSLLSLACLAEISAKGGKHNNTILIYDDVELSNEFDMSHLFGPYAERIKPPCRDEEGNPVCSDTIEEFESNFSKVYKAAKRTGRNFVYVLDSFDALTSETELELREKNIKNREAGKKQSGTFGTTKAKFSSEFFRTIKKKLNETNSCLIIVSQTREDINPLSFTTKKRTGGKALDFYSSVVMWLAKKESIKNKKHNLQIGIITKVKISKNKITGRNRDFEFPIYYDYGVDDIASCVNWLIENKFWTGSRKAINTKSPMFGGIIGYSALIKLIEENGLEGYLKKVIQSCWDEVEDDLKIERKRRYE